MRFRAVFFDAGETLVHPEPSFHDLFRRVLNQAGHDRTRAAVAEASAKVFESFRQAAEDGSLWTTSPELSRSFWMSVYGPMLSELSLPSSDGLADVLYTAFTDRTNYSLFDDVVPALDQLAATGVELGLISNFEAWLEELLVDLEMIDRLPVRAISGIEGVQKPGRELFVVALERAGVEPEEAAYVGDNPYFDVDPPAQLGMFPVLIDRLGRHESFDGTRITSMSQLVEVLA